MVQSSIRWLMGLFPFQVDGCAVTVCDGRGVIVNDRSIVHRSSYHWRVERQPDKSDG